jgi:hypothetical protein
MDMKRRIVGMETEYALLHLAKPGARNKALSGTELFEYMNQNLEKTGVRRLYEEKYYPESRGEPFSSFEERRRYSMKKNRMFLENGARFYLDTGDHPEYATPECTSAEDLLIYEKAGERFTNMLGEIAEKKLEENDIGGQVILCKNNIDIRGNTYGCHENYLIPRRSPRHNESSFFKLVIRELIPFLVTRQIYCGTGKILSGNKLGFQISQRADFIDSELSSDTTFRRGIINSRDEPLSRIDVYRRLHILIGDSALSPLATYLKVGTTMIILKLIEEGELDNDMQLEDPILSLREISSDPACGIKVRLIDGNYLGAMEIQRFYLKKAQNYYERNKPDEETRNVLEKWEWVLNRLDNDRESLRYEIDWIGKLAIIDRLLSRHNTSYQQLNKWVYLIKRIKSLKLEQGLLVHHNDNQEMDVEEYLKARVNKGDYIELKRHARYNEIEFSEYFDMHRKYHQLLKLDFLFHDIRPNRGLFLKMRAEAKGELHFGGDDFATKVDKAMKKPPSDTRARIRSDFLKAALEFKAKGSVNWDSVSLHGLKLHKVNLMDPFATEDEEVNTLISEMRQYSHIGNSDENLNKPSLEN